MRILTGADHNKGMNFNLALILITLPLLQCQWPRKLRFESNEQAKVYLNYINLFCTQINSSKNQKRKKLTKFIEKKNQK